MAFFDTLKRGAKKLGKDAAKAAKSAADGPAPEARPGEQLTVAFRPEKNDWVVKRPSGTVKRKAENKREATQIARQEVATSEKYTQFQVLNQGSESLGDIVETRESMATPDDADGDGPYLPGFTDENGDVDDSQPFVPDLGGGGSTQGKSGSENQPYVPESLFDR